MNRKILAGLALLCLAAGPASMPTMPPMDRTVELRLQRMTRALPEPSNAISGKEWGEGEKLRLTRSVKEMFEGKDLELGCGIIQDASVDKATGLQKVRTAVALGGVRGGAYFSNVFFYATPSAPVFINHSSRSSRMWIKGHCSAVETYFTGKYREGAPEVWLTLRFETSDFGPLPDLPKWNAPRLVTTRPSTQPAD